MRAKGPRDDERNGLAEETYYYEIEGLVANLVIDPEEDAIKHFTIFGTIIVAIFIKQEDEDTEADIEGIISLVDDTLSATFIHRAKRYIGLRATHSGLAHLFD